MSTIKAGAIVALDGTSPVTLTGQSAAKAWVLYTNRASTVVRDSFNNSSVTDNAVGKWTVNFTNSMASAWYCTNGSAGDGSNADNPRTTAPAMSTNPTASAVGMATTYTTTLADQGYNSASINGDLA